MRLVDQLLFISFTSFALCDKEMLSKFIYLFYALGYQSLKQIYRKISLSKIKKRKELN